MSVRYHDRIARPELQTGNIAVRIAFGLVVGLSGLLALSPPCRGEDPAAADTLSRLAPLNASPQRDAGTVLRDLFRNPSPDLRPLIITHAGPLNAPDMLTWLAVRRAGGAVLDAGVKPGSKDLGEEPWDNPTYLDDSGQFDKLRRTVAQLKQQDSRVWLYDELGYPSGSAGGRVLADHPEYQVEVISCRTFRCAAGEKVEIAVPQERPVEACYALPSHDGQLAMAQQIDLTERARGGSFSWQAPSGQWLVCLFQRFQPDTWRRHNIPRRNVNILSRGAVAHFLKLTHERYARELADQLPDIDAFFTDEPQFGSAEHWGGGLADSLPMIQWCDELPELFRQRHGIDVRGILPALFHAVGPTTAKHRHDFYDVQSDLVAENYFGQLETWCRAHGVASSGHMLLEESLLFHVMFSGSMLKNWARMDLPGVDLLGLTPYHTMGGWNGDFVPVPEDFSCKLASSVTHLRGKQGTFTESYALADRASLRQVLGVAAWQFAEGITHMSTYSIQQALSAADYASFSDFAGRLALIARRGTHVADVAVLVPESSVWATYTPPDGGRFLRYLQCNPEPILVDQIFREACHQLLRHQRDFDCLSEELLQQASVRDGRLYLADESFALLMLPEMRMMEPATRGKVREFLAQGGHVIFVGRLPHQSPQQGDDPLVTADMEALLAAFPDRVRHEPRWQSPSPWLSWIDNHVPPAVRWQGDDGVRILHRREPGRDFLLVSNPGRAAATGELTVPVSGTASVWDPETGEISVLGPLTRAAAVTLHVPAESARVLVMERENDAE